MALTADPAEWALARATWQPVVFAESPRRFDLLRLDASWPLTSLRLIVHRNQPFEFVATPLKHFLAYAGRALDVSVGPYDDSLQFAGDGGQADAEIVWLDFQRYRDLSCDDLAAWVDGRIRARRAISSMPILVADNALADQWVRGINARLRSSLADLPGVTVVAISEVADQLGDEFFDERARTITASALSDRGAIEVARRLAFEWLLSRIEPRIKVVAVDLDGTLYSGVLGEDGPAGLSLLPAHRAIQEALVALRREGVLLALVSRNRPDDVGDLFRRRVDFPLRADHFSFQATGWGAKWEGLTAAAEALRIGTDAILFVDDNPGEIAGAAAGVPGLRCLLASDPPEVARALRLYPGLTGYRMLASDALRAADLAADSARAQIAGQAVDHASYVRSLRVRLGFAMNSQADSARLSELSMKTNQFNTSLTRLSEAEVDRRLSRDDCRTIAVTLADRLSDAGTIAAIFTRRDGNVLVVDEIDISCRALGRGVEHFLICVGVVRAGRDLGLDAVRFVLKEGPRNEPARTCIRRLSADKAPPALVPIANLAACARLLGDDIEVSWK